MHLRVATIPEHFITDDKALRFALKKKLGIDYHGDSNTKVVEELGITSGTARIDIAVVNGVIHGYELKSDRDTLNRLPSQMKIYNSVFDQITLVVGKNHLHGAIKIVPEWWGITVARKVKFHGPVSLYEIRKPAENPHQNVEALVTLLWRNEALNILENMGKATGVRSKNRKVIYKRLVQSLDKETLSARIREHLRARANWKSDLRYMPSDD